MRAIIFRLSEYKFYSYDEVDKENIEERRILGYFSSEEMLNDSIRLCIESGIDESCLSINAYSLILRKGQRYIFELSYSYSVKTTSGNYVDYDYIFEPKASKDDCLKLKKRLVRQYKFQPTTAKIFDPSVPAGCWVERYDINKLYSVVGKS